MELEVTRERHLWHWSALDVERFWKAVYAYDLAPSRTARAKARHVVSILSLRCPAPARVLLVGDRDPAYAEALLAAGYQVRRAAIGEWLIPSQADLASHPNWRGVASDTDHTTSDVVFAPDVLPSLLEEEIEPFFALLRISASFSGTLVLTVPTGERLEQQLAICPSTGAMFHREQRLRSYTRESLRLLLEAQGLTPKAELEIDASDAGFLSIQSHIDQLRKEDFVHVGAGSSLFVVAASAAEAAPRADDAALANRWLSRRREIAVQAETPSAGAWEWTAERVAAFWSALAGTPLDSMSFGITNGLALLRGIERWLVPEGRHLDVGAGEGHMAHHLAAANYPVAVFEPAPGRAQGIRARLGGHPNFLGLLQTIDEQNTNAFDVVFACEVIEHVLDEDISDFFALLERALATDGRLILTTPNRENLQDSVIYSPAADILFHRWQHVRSFNRESLSKLVSQHGFEIERIHELDLAAVSRASFPLSELIIGSDQPIVDDRAPGLLLVAHKQGRKPRVAGDLLMAHQFPATDPWTAAAKAAAEISALPPTPTAVRAESEQPSKAARRLARISFDLLRPVLRRILPAVVKRQLAPFVPMAETALAIGGTEAFAKRRATLAASEPLLSAESFVGGPIILCNNALAWGGVERQVVNTFRGVANRLGRAPFLLCVRLGWDPDYDFYKAALADYSTHLRNAMPLDAAQQILSAANPDYINRILATASWMPDDVQEEVIRFAAEFVALKPAVVHVWQDALSISAGYAAKLVGVPNVIVSSRNMAARRFAYHRPYMADAYRELASCSDIVMLNNSLAGAMDYAEWLGISPQRYGLIRNGVDPDEIARPDPVAVTELKERIGLPNKAVVVGSIFRFYPEKRPQLWIETAAAIARRRPDVHFVIFGTGPMKPNMSRVAERAGFGDRTHFPGTIEDAALGLSVMDLLLLTSEFEGTPNVVLEASLMGLPVVATPAGGTKEAIDPGVTGYVVSDDSAQSLAEQVIAALENSLWLESVKATGPRFIESTFGLDRMLDETLAIYKAGL